MKSANGKTFVYDKNQIIEVICQLRFPPILSIETDIPAQFQDTVREVFPRYNCIVENLPVQPGAPAQTQKNHTFVSEDGLTKLSLTKNFIALSTMRYGGWEEFAHKLDEPLGQFIRIYRPAYFERVGLRFVNGISRQKLELTHCRWNDLFQSQYLGVLDNDSIDENAVAKCVTEVEMKLDDKCSLKLHAGPGNIRRNIQTPNGIQTIQEPETRFLFDQDLFCGGNIKLPDVMDTLALLHEHADRTFSEAITDTLHDAMEPVEL